MGRIKDFLAIWLLPDEEAYVARMLRIKDVAWLRECGGTNRLSGIYAHWCAEWDEMPVDETTPEFQCCNCFDGWCFRIVRWLSTRIVNAYLSYREWQARRREERRQKAVIALVSSGAITVNEAREMCGQGPLIESESRAHMATLELENDPR